MHFEREKQLIKHKIDQTSSIRYGKEIIIICFI